MHLLAFSWLIACQAPSPAEDRADAGPADSATDTGLGESGSGTAQIAPEWTADAAIAAAESLFARGAPDPYDLLAVYFGLMSHGDADCPASDTEISQDFVLGCTADSGYSYAGVAIYEPFEEKLKDGVMVGWAMGGDFEITDPKGQRFRVGGHTSHGVLERADGQREVLADITGSWQLDGGTDWLGDGLGTMLLIEGMMGAGDSGDFVADGGVQVADVSVDLDGLYWDTAGCWEQPVGALGIRDPGGLWYTLELSDDCSGCGPLVYGGEATGESGCVDLSSWRDAWFSGLGAVQ